MIKALIKIFKNIFAKSNIYITFTTNFKDMDKEKLMIENWVWNTHNQKPEQIRELLEIGVMLDYNDIYGYDEIGPIPLSNEILMKNGIELVEVGDHGPATPKHLYNRYEKWLVHTQWKDTFLWFDRRTKKYHLQEMNGFEFDSVHGLQQALLLNGVEKKIVL